MQLITRTICTWLFILSTVLIWGQGTYDLQFVVSTLDCTNDQLCVDIQIRATDAASEFNLANQNYRFTFSSNLANPVIAQELTLSGFVVEMGQPSLWDPHDLTGSVGNLVSYNVQLAGGSGYPLNSTNWLAIGQVCFDIISNTPEDCFQFNWNEPGVDFPPTVILGNDAMGLPFSANYNALTSVGITCAGSVCSQPPIALDDPFILVENNILNGDVSLNDTEPDGEIMTWNTTPLSGPNNGMIVLNADGTFSYTPNAGFVGMDTVEYEVCDQTMPPFCDTALILINVLPCSNFAQINATPALCAPQATFNATDIGITANYDWNFGPLATPTTASGLGPHNVSFSSGGSQSISLTVTIGSCIDPIVQVVDVVENLQANPIIQDVTCQGFNDGQVDLNVSGGTAPYTFIWTNAATTEINTGLMPGGYNVIIRDQNNCFATASITIDNPPLFGNSVFSSQGVLCFGEFTGIALATPNGGVSPYTFIWDNGETTAQATQLSGGIHSVTVTDLNTCSIESTVDIFEAPAFLAMASVDQDASCNGFMDGSGSVIAMGGTGVFTYLWDNGETTAQATQLNAGLHLVTVTDENVCEQTAQITIGEPTAILSNIALLQDVSCQSGSDGSASVSPSGGLAPYTFLWSTGETNATATTLSDGLSMLTLTDNSGCSIIESILVNEPSLLTVATSVDANLLCNGDQDGSASAVPSGGTVPYTFLWDNGETQSSATALNGGVHTVTLTDANACEATSSITISEPSALGLSLNLVDEPACMGDSNGSVQAIPSGGTNPYTYLWDNGETNALATGLDAGVASITLTDGNACTLVETINITEPDLLEAILGSVNPVSCPGENDGSITFDILGGTSSFLYSWSGPVSGSNIQTLNGSATANNLEAGTYSITVQDGNNCIAVLSMIDVSEPDMIDANLVGSVPVTCNTCNGVATIDVMGGAMPYTFEWGNGNTNQNPDDLCAGLNVVSVTDNNGCLESFGFIINSATNLTIDNAIIEPVSCAGGSDGMITLEVTNGIYPYSYQWSPNVTETDSIAENLSAGTYFVTVFDNTGCAIANFYDVSEPPPLDLVVNVLSNNACPGDMNGSIETITTGGTPPYTFQWDDPAMQTTAVATGLAGGIYTVTLSDANLCSLIGTASINSPNPYITSISVLNDVVCNGESNGSAELTVSGATPDYTFLWDNGETNAIASALNAGIHTVTISDQQGCETTDQIQINEPSVLTLSVVEDMGLNCNGDSNGIATASPSGGIPDYTYSWDNGETTASTTGLDGGMHQLTVTDNNGCFISGTVDISEPSALDLQIILDAGVSCNGLSDGQATATVSGGNGNYTFAWDNGETTANAMALNGGLHELTVTDIQSCSIIESINIPEPDAINLSFNLNQGVQCFGETNGAAEVIATGGSPDYTYLWDNGETNALATSLDLGLASVTITDSNACEQTADFDIPGPDQALVVFTIPQNDGIECFGEVDGSALAVAGGGTQPYTYLWDNGETNFLATALDAGLHEVTLTDANGCEADATILIDGPAEMLTAVPNLLNDVSCFGGNDGSVNIVSNGGTAPYNYIWSNGSTDDFANNLAAGTVSVTVFDTNNCETIASIVINEPSLLSIQSLSVQNVSCRNFADGFIEVDGVGGTQPYTFLWSNGASTNQISNLPEGNYNISLTDANNCLSVESFVITQPDNPLDIQVTTSIDILCFGDLNGEATVQPNGGEAPYDYIWDSGETNATASMLSAGRHSVTITDNVGCSVVVDTVDIGGPEEPLMASLTLEEPTCFGDSDGQLSIDSTSGGTGPYVYSLNGELFGIDSLFFGLAGGTYQPIIQDANGCELRLDTFLTEPFELIVLIDPETSFIELGESLDLNSQVNTTEAIAYSWMPAEGLSCIDCPNPEAMPLFTTNYTLTIRDSSGCTASAESLVEIDPERGVFVPNAFSPNEDGVNDHFQIFGDASVQSIQTFRIFDRWGELVFTANNFQPNDLTFAWDGTLNGQEMNPGVYVYFVEVLFIDGISIPLSGDVTLIR